MQNKKTDAQRRALLKGIAVVPLAVALGHQTLAMAEDLSPNDPMAKALGYMEKSDKPEHCAICNLWKGGDAARGQCAIFGKKDVARTGWCKSWTKKVG